MYKAFVLVRNLESSAASLDFGDFSINLVHSRFKELGEVLSSMGANPDDWIFEKSYGQLPGRPDTPDGGITNDIEDTLLLLRLYRVGDISFIKQAIIQPSGIRSVQPPSRSMNDLNSYFALKFKIETEECQSWKTFADGIRESASWSADWFAVARRFFLSGGAKPFHPERDEVDRIVDYTTALESTLVPEKDYITRRIINRAAALIAQGDPTVTQVVRFMKRLYDIRSRIVHGNRLEEKDGLWLLENSDQVELRVREILKMAVTKLPPIEKDRSVTLAELYDPTDDDRGKLVLEKFKEIKTPEVRKMIAAEIGKTAGE